MSSTATAPLWKVVNGQLVPTGAASALPLSIGSGLLLPSIPTSDPSVANQVWASSGVLLLSGHTLPSGGGGSWTESAGLLYPTTISDKVGIGTTSPSASLDIQAQSGQTVPLLALRGSDTVQQAAFDVDGLWLGQKSVGLGILLHPYFHGGLSEFYVMDAAYNVRPIHAGDSYFLSVSIGTPDLTLSRSAASVMTIGDGSTGLGGLVAGMASFTKTSYTETGSEGEGCMYYDLTNHLLRVKTNAGWKTATLA